MQHAGNEHIHLNVIDDRVEIVNLGGLLFGLTKENFGKESVRRNLIIVDLFHRMRRLNVLVPGLAELGSL